MPVSYASVGPLGYNANNKRLLTLPKYDSTLATVLEFEVLPNCQIAIFLVSMRKGEVWEPYTFIPLDDTICISILG